MISTVPTPAALSSTTSARQTGFCGALRRRSAEISMIEIPVRMRQTRMPTHKPES
jgi:hypothetical protein